MAAAEGGGSDNSNFAPGFFVSTNMSEHAMENEADCAVNTKFPKVSLPRLL